MLKQYFRLLLLASACLVCIPTAWADTMPSGKKDRKGFFIGFALGGTALTLDGGGEQRTEEAYAFDMKIGGGLSEKALLMFNPSSQRATFDGIQLDVDNFSIALQMFIWKNAYIRPGIGFSVTTASISSGGTIASAETDGAIGLDFAAGYEFRIGKGFSLSPEFIYHYSRLDGKAADADGHGVGAQASLLWYF